MRLVGTSKLQRGRRITLLEEIAELTRWREGDVLVQLYDDEKNAVVIVKREDYERWQEDALALAREMYELGKRR